MTGLNKHGKQCIVVPTMLKWDFCTNRSPILLVWGHIPNPLGTASLAARLYETLMQKISIFDKYKNVSFLERFYHFP